MSIFYVYILETIASNGKKSYYTGYTQDLYNRWNQHRKGTGAKFCQGKTLTLKYFETFTSKKEAMKREIEIKSFTRKKKEELINSMNNS